MKLNKSYFPRTGHKRACTCGHTGHGAPVPDCLPGNSTHRRPRTWLGTHLINSEVGSLSLDISFSSYNKHYIFCLLCRTSTSRPDQKELCAFLNGPFYTIKLLLYASNFSGLWKLVCAKRVNDLLLSSNDFYTGDCAWELSCKYFRHLPLNDFHTWSHDWGKSCKYSRMANYYLECYLGSKYITEQNFEPLLFDTFEKCIKIRNTRTIEHFSIVTQQSKWWK